jgi:hypothetical protein
LSRSAGFAEHGGDAEGEEEEEMTSIAAPGKQRNVSEGARQWCPRATSAVAPPPTPPVDGAGVASSGKHGSISRQQRACGVCCHLVERVCVRAVLCVPVSQAKG